MQMTLRQARLKSGLTQRETAKNMGISESTWRRLEQDPGKMSMRGAKIFCELVGVPLESLVFCNKIRL